MPSFIPKLFQPAYLTELFSYYLKYILIGVSAVMYGSFGYTQDAGALQQIVPPSPEAISVLKYGNTTVNYYTGSPSLGIPLYSFSSRGINAAIGLSYSSFGGIKVEEMAGSVGLGWSLNAGGVVSRTINGLADDRNYGSQVGYFYVPELDWPTYCESGLSDHDDSLAYNMATYFLPGYWDAQPDLYHYNVDGLSGSFYINQQKEIIYKPETDVKIRPVFSGQALDAFELTGPDGTRYYFDEKETSRMVAVDGAIYDDLYNTSSWYLKTIHDGSGNLVASFEYFSNTSHETHQVLQSPFQYSDLDSPDDMISSNMSYNRLHTRTPVLKGISFVNGSVSFVYGGRKDLEGGYRVDSILVSNVDSEAIKTFSFHYSYFDSSGVSALSSTERTVIISGALEAYGDPYKRLKLDSVCEWNADASDKQVYGFVYDTTTFLPSRYSCAQDHWGYYNGMLTNNSLEQYHRELVYSNVSTAVGLEAWGSADREPHMPYNKAAVLQEVVYPTGGSTVYDYEQHTATDSALANDTLSRYIDITTDEVESILKVNLINVPFAIVTVGSIITGPCFAEIEIRDSATNELIHGFTRAPGLGTDSTFKLLAGTYKVKAKRNSYYVTCEPESDYIYFNWDDEVLRLVKKVGGLRVKEITDYSDRNAGEVASRRHFFYNESGSEDSSASTATLVSLPRYSYPLLLQLQLNWGTLGLCPDIDQSVGGAIRKITTAYPLLLTNGSPVGYKKVTVVEEGEANKGKSEYYFTTVDDYPDMRDGYISSPLSKDAESFFNGEWIERLPQTPIDDRDFMRGLMTREIQYEYFDEDYRAVSKTEQTYTLTFPLPVPDSVVGNEPTYAVIDGMHKIYGQVYYRYPKITGNPEYDAESGEFVGYAKQYNIYTGRIDVTKSVSTIYQYNDSSLSDSIQTTTEYVFSDNTIHKDSLFYTQVNEVHTIASDGSVSKTIFQYPYHKDDVSGLSAAQSEAVDSLVAKNIISQPFQVTTYKDTALLSTTRTDYQVLSGGYVQPAGVEYAVLYNPLEALIAFNAYDTVGNLLEQQKKNDVKISYVWGYNNAYPIAQVQNAPVTDIFYTSFEDSSGNSDMGDSKTGKWSHSNALIKTLTGLTNGDYVLSYWKKVSGEWAFYNSVVTVSTGSYTIGLAGQLDEVRFYPAGARMSTYTYDPLIGMTSQCDVNNKVLYYEYDGFNRLLRIRDEDSVILKQYDYRYQLPARYYNALLTDTVVRNNCSSGYVGDTLVYTVAAASYSSGNSQADADQQALDDVAANGQSWANSNGGCLLLYYNISKTGSFTRNNCATNYTGSTVSYTVAAGTYSSSISQAAADQLAQDDVDANGQTYANANGSCTLSACTTSNCSGVDKKCVSGVCETGTKVYTSSVYMKINNPNGSDPAQIWVWRCTYHYVWSDCSTSSDYTEDNSSSCSTGGGCTGGVEPV